MTWMDLVRGVCIVLVVLFHGTVVSQEAGLAVPTYVKVFNDAFDPFRMPLLMFLSGMLLGVSLRKDTRVYLYGKFAQIYWPFLIWSMAVLTAENRLTIEYIIKTPISAPTFLWYLWFLTAYYVICLSFRYRQIPLILFCASSLLLSTIAPDFLRMPRFFFLLAFFVFGHWVTQQSISMRGRAAVLLLAVGAALVGAVVSASGTTIKYNVLYVWAPLGGALAVLSLGNYSFTSRALSAFEWVGRNSLVFYVCHLPVQRVSTQAMMLVSTEFELVFVTVIFLSLAVGVALVWLRNRSLVADALFDFRSVVAVGGAASRLFSKRVWDGKSEAAERRQ